MDNFKERKPHLYRVVSRAETLDGNDKSANLKYTQTGGSLVPSKLAFKSPEKGPCLPQICAAEKVNIVTAVYSSNVCGLSI